eukprot:CCRYP_012611-RA/>CCRYP_012611-RA protein AED:0.36 eAED:0.40 QI:0/0/0/1/0/0/2/0/92
MPGYLKKQSIKYNHPPSKKPVNTPWEPYPVQLGSKIQRTLPADESYPSTKTGSNASKKLILPVLLSSHQPYHPHAIRASSTQQANLTKITLK